MRKIHVNRMLRKSPERRMSNLELLRLPELRHAVREAYCRAKRIMPNVDLPAILFPADFSIVSNDLGKLDHQVILCSKKLPSECSLR